MKTIIIFSIFSLFLVLGCTGQKPITEINVPGHEIVYVFRNDIHKSILIDSNDENAIYELLRKEEKLNIIFNGTDESDNGIFQSVIVDMVSKVPFYLAQEGKDTLLTSYYFMSEGSGTQWYNSTGDMIDEPALDGATIMLVGPSTGANETSVRLSGKTIIVQGTSYPMLSLAVDKFTLIAFGIFDINQIMEESGNFVYTPRQ